VESGNFILVTLNICNLTLKICKNVSEFTKSAVPKHNNLQKWEEFINFANDKKEMQTA
jgi:hypothetical protein